MNDSLARRLAKAKPKSQVDPVNTQELLALQEQNRSLTQEQMQLIAEATAEIQRRESMISALQERLAVQDEVINEQKEAIQEMQLQQALVSETLNFEQDQLPDVAAKIAQLDAIDVTKFNEKETQDELEAAGVQVMPIIKREQKNSKRRAARKEKAARLERLTQGKPSRQ